MQPRTIYEIPGLQGNDIAQLDAFQTLLLPHINLIQTAWWLIFTATGTFLLAKFILVPLWQTHVKKSRRKK